MVYEFPEITEELSRREGTILAAWFTVSPAGPTAFSIGYVETPEHYELFYSLHSFADFRAWKLQTYKKEFELDGYAWGDALLTAMVKLRNAGLRAEPQDYAYFAKLPDVLITNGHPAIYDAFEDLVTVVNAGRDWSVEMFLLNRYGPSLIRKARWQIRSHLEFARKNRDANKEKLAAIAKKHIGKPGFDDWALPDLPATYTNRALVRQWSGIIAAPHYVEQALWRISQMWLLAPEWNHMHEAMAGAEHGTRISFREMADFFDRFRLPLWPRSLNDLKVRLDIQLSGC